MDLKEPSDLDQKEKSKTTSAHKKMARELFILIGILLVVIIYMIFDAWLDRPVFRPKAIRPPLSSKQKEKFGEMVVFLYKHTKGYSIVCEKEGYILTKYPADSEEYLSDYIFLLKRSVSDYSYSYNVLEAETLDEARKEEVEKTIYDELDVLKKRIIKQIVAKKRNIPVGSVEWNDAWNDSLLLKNVCSVFDAKGMELLQKGEDKDLFIRQLLKQ